MMPPSHERTRLLQAVRVAMTSTLLAEQQSYLEREVGTGPYLRTAMESLVKGRQTTPSVPRSVVAPRREHISGSADQESAPGELIDDRFEIIRPIRHGGTSTVFEARDIVTSETVAVKKLDPLRVGRRGLGQALLMRDAQSRRLENPNIIRVYFAGHTPNLDYLVMEFVHGYTPRRVACPSRSSMYDQPGGHHSCHNSKRAIHDAHQAGIKHLDLKPENILIPRTDDEPNGAIEKLKLIDFGLSRSNMLDTEASAKSVLFTGGTPGFMAPEQVGQDGDEQSDVFALGMLLVYLCHGSSPFGEGVFHDLQSKLLHAKTVADVHAIRQDYCKLLDSKHICEIIADPVVAAIAAKCLRLNPADRYPSAAALQNDLVLWQRDYPTNSAYLYTWREHWTLFARRCSRRDHDEFKKDQARLWGYVCNFCRLFRLVSSVPPRLVAFADTIFRNVHSGLQVLYRSRLRSLS